MFKSTKVQKHGKGLKITGLLTIRDQTKTVHLISKDMPTKPIKDPRGNWRIAVSATTSIKRHDFNILFDQKLPTGGLLVGEEVQIDINAELTRKDAKDSKAAELTHENPKYSTNQEKSSQNVHKKTPKKPMQNEQQETIQANNGQTNESENLSEELEKQEQQEQENQQQTSED